MAGGCRAAGPQFRRCGCSSAVGRHRRTAWGDCFALKAGRHALSRSHPAGTPDYASMSGLYEDSLGPKDDMEALAYTLLFLWLGRLPW